MISASSRTATARPRPISFISVMLVNTKQANTDTITSAAAPLPVYLVGAAFRDLDRETLGQARE
jgi:hypothetical protein